MDKKEKQTRNEKALARIDKIRNADTKKLAKLLTLFFGLIMIVVMTITNFAIAEDFNFFTWFSNAMILAGIMVFGIFLGESLGADKQMERPNGLYQKALANYNKTFVYVEPKLCYFAQWFNWYMPRELENKKISILIENGIDSKKAKNIVKYCSSHDAEALKSHPLKYVDEKGNDIYIGKIEDYQFEAVSYVLGGKVKLETCNASYYLTATGSTTNKSVLERATQLDKQIKFNKRSNRIKKITFSLGISLILGLFAVDHVMGAGEAQAWMNLVSRVAALLTSFISGWASSITDVRLKAEKIDNKIMILRLFNYSLVIKEFVPESDEEIVKKQYEDWEKNIIQPDEILTEEDLKNKLTIIK